MSMPEAKIFFTEFFPQTCLAGDRAAVGGAGEMTNQRTEMLKSPDTTGTRRVATLRGLRHLTAARSPARRPIASALSRSDACSVDEVVVALHASAVARNRRHGDAVARSDGRRGSRGSSPATSPPMPAEGHRHQDLLTPATGEPGSLVFERIDPGHVGIDEIERGQLARKLRRVVPSGAARAIATARSASASSHCPSGHWSKRPSACGRR